MQKTPIYFPTIDKEINIFHNEYNIDDISKYTPLVTTLENLYSQNGIINYYNGTLNSITVNKIIKFNNNIGFVLMDFNIFDEDNNKIPGIVFSRNNSVSILATSFYKGKEYALIITQPRTSIGLIYNEIVAGIIENNNIKGSIINELKEEAGINIDINKLNYLGNTIPSCGACNETIELYHTFIPDMVNLVNNSNNNVFGNSSENEKTKRKVILLDDILKCTNDSKSHISYFYYKSNLSMRLFVLFEYLKYLFYYFLSNNEMAKAL